MVELVEFPADDLERARRFWQAVLSVELEERREGEGSGVQTHDGAADLGVHPRGAVEKCNPVSGVGREPADAGIRNGHREMER